jgi:hypothetical protein
MCPLLVAVLLGCGVVRLGKGALSLGVRSLQRARQFGPIDLAGLRGLGHLPSFG